MRQQRFGNRAASLDNPFKRTSKLLGRPKTLVAVLLIISATCSCSPRPYCNFCASSGPRIDHNDTLNLDDGNYSASFTNAAIASTWVEADGELVNLTIPDRPVTQVTVRRVSPTPLTMDDADPAYRAAVQYCRLLLRNPEVTEVRGRGHFYVESKSWVFQGIC